MSATKATITISLSELEALIQRHSAGSGPRGAHTSAAHTEPLDYRVLGA